MLSLENADERFKIKFEVIENGLGTFGGVIDEINQVPGSTAVFSAPRRILRVDKLLPINTRMVVRTQGGTVCLVGLHGDSESFQGTVFRSFRLFQATNKYSWERRVSEIDTVTQLPKTEGMRPMDPPMIWGSYEPTPELFDREHRVPIETARFITNHPVQRQDRIDGKDVARVDYQLGLYIATLA